jgi:hypothetical protein
VVGTGTVGSDGTFDITTSATFNIGTHTFTATETDTASLTSAASSPAFRVNVTTLLPMLTDNNSSPTPLQNIIPVSELVDSDRSFQLPPATDRFGDGFGSGSGTGFFVVHTDAVLTTASDATVQINLALAALEAPLGGDVVLVTARQANGDPLPDWLKFDPSTVTFAGLPPGNAVASIEPDHAADNNVVTGSISPNPDLGIAGLDTPAQPNTVTIEVTARDSKGNIAVSVFTIDLRAHTANKQGWYIDRTTRPFGYQHHTSTPMLSPELAAIEAAVRDVTRPFEPFGTRGMPVGYGDRTSAGAAEAVPAGRAGLTEQLASIGWRSMAAQRNALLASLQQGR